MTSRQQWTVVGAIVVALAGAAWAGVHFLGDEFVQVTVGSKAPDFQAVTLDSVPAPRSFAQYKGKVTLVNIWATWCVPCEQEMPMLEKLYKELSPKGFHIAAVSVDAPGMEKPIREFVARHGLTFDVMYTSDGSIQRDYMTTGYPESFIVGKDGVIRYKQFVIREADVPQLRALIEQLLSEGTN